MALSAIIESKTLEHPGRRLLAWAQRQWIGEIIHVCRAGDEVASCREPLKRAPIRQGGENGDRASVVGHLDGLSRLDASKQLARSLSELADPHT